MQLCVRNFLLAGIFAFAVSALVQAAWSAERPSFPSNYRDLVAEQIKSSFFFPDPYSLRDVAIASPSWDGPVPAYSDPRPAWLVCFRANSKNKQGGYEGIRTYVYAIRDGVGIWYFSALVSPEDAAGAMAADGLAGYIRTMRASGWAEDDIVWHLEDLIVTTFVHAYCRHADWRPWPELEGR